MGWAVISDEEFQESEWDLWFADLGVESEKLKQMKSYQKCNHFPAMYQCARKNFLAKNLKRLQKFFPEQYEFFPKTWSLPSEVD